ncbi:structure-specific endonuclease subunit slx1-like [Lineus longissimus]|uniref:structure-specific endonuclease subunit slx1-like n=1 Tax=Lineus longissimus TaxID=88925 RepID=UPI002B4F8EA2
MAQEVEDFYGCYLLYCENPKFKGRTYIGYTVNPTRRIGQHNKGKKAGGAWRTSGRGPWSMVLIVHGFPNDISALRFEWAWQHPTKSRRLKSIQMKKKNEHGYKSRFRTLSYMLRTGPWKRLPLTIRWLEPKYKLDFEPDLLPPAHMAIAYGPVVSKKIQSPKKALLSTQESNAQKTGCDDEDDIVVISQTQGRCSVCSRHVKNEDEALMKCLHRHCNMLSHMKCLAKYFLRESDHLLPVEGDCPKCKKSLVWGELIRYQKGCYQYLNEASEDEDQHWADELHVS